MITPMNRQTWLSILCVLFGFLAVASAQTISTNAQCRVTIPSKIPDIIQGHLWSKKVYSSGNLYATADHPDGILMFRPEDLNPDGTMDLRKLGWFKINGLSGSLTISGRRLDGTAPPLISSIPSGYRPTGFQASGITFPTEGCWEITGKVADTKLTFVVQVIKER
jgi:hypothetical protein